eukprot:TRINITY_DN68216_c0_g1_i1.p1 TRINITY_DN68216_c0_g1~~TRINITY_DN68216_c0_g1_i1.p1  ORF type:complete len:276 (-),score=21.10 TRINITY_DN68216_c0_g1_i1:326-1153(-)
MTHPSISNGWLFEPHRLSRVIIVSPETMSAWVLPVIGLLETIAIASTFVALSRTSLALVAGLHVVSSCMRSSMLVSYALMPNWFTRRKLFWILMFFLLSSWVLCISSASAAFTLNPDLEHASDLKFSLLALHSFLVSTIMSTIVADRSWMMLQPSMPPLQREIASEDVEKYEQALDDIISQTFVIEQVEGGNNNEDIKNALEVCCFCLCHMVPGELISELSCRHRYHNSCVERWCNHQARIGKAVRCPLRCDVHAASQRESENLGPEVAEIHIVV